MLPRTCFPSAAIRRRFCGRLIPHRSAYPAIHERRRLTQCRDIVITLPGLISGQPPVTDTGLAWTIVRVDHAPMLECPLVVTPAALTVAGRPEIAASSAAAWNVGPKPLGIGRHALDLTSRFP